MIGVLIPCVHDWYTVVTLSMPNVAELFDSDCVHASCMPNVILTQLAHVINAIIVVVLVTVVCLISFNYL